MASRAAMSLALSPSVYPFSSLNAGSPPLDETPKQARPRPTPSSFCKCSSCSRLRAPRRLRPFFGNTTRGGPSRQGQLRGSGGTSRTHFGEAVWPGLFSKASGRIVGERLVGQLTWSLGRVADVGLLPPVRKSEFTPHHGLKDLNPSVPAQKLPPRLYTQSSRPWMPGAGPDCGANCRMRAKMYWETRMSVCGFVAPCMSDS